MKGREPGSFERVDILCCRIVHLIRNSSVKTEHRKDLGIYERLNRIITTDGVVFKEMRKKNSGGTVYFTVLACKQMLCGQKNLVQSIHSQE